MDARKPRRRDWKSKLRESCLKRVRQQRNVSLWKSRTPASQAFEKIVVDELHKISVEDRLWEDASAPLPTELSPGEYEELLIAMQKAIYDEVHEAEMQDFEHVELQEQRSLAELLEQTQEQSDAVLCPICRRGHLQEASRTIRCNSGCFILNLQSIEAGLELVRSRLAELLGSHSTSGCPDQPVFSYEQHLQAIFMQCNSCGCLEVVI